MSPLAVGADNNYVDRAWPFRWVALPLLWFGRAPLFFYVMHWFAIFAEYGIVSAATSGALNLAWSVPMFLVVVPPMAILCRWYGNFKRNKPADSIWKFF